MERIIKENLEDIVKGLLLIILLLVLVITVFLYKKNDEPEHILESQMVEELLAEPTPATVPVELTEVASSEQIEQKVIIDIKGAVEAPGVYEMQTDNRVIDCIEKAGGFLVDAEQKSVNLAQKVEDQMVIYIPKKGEDFLEIEQLLPDKPVSHSNDEISKIDLNKATKEELKSLNGIGDTKADNIISYRETNGFFKNIEDIKNVSGIGEATFEKLREAIQVTP